MDTITKIVPFDFKDHSIRTIKIANEIWFIASDISKILGYKDAHNMIKKLDIEDTYRPNLDQEDTTPPFGGVNQVTDYTRELLNNAGRSLHSAGTIFINESGMYDSVIRSRKKEARVFKRWLTSEVLPTIRKTGSYHHKPKPSKVKTKVEAVDEMVLVNKLFRSNLSLAKAIFKGNQAILSANNATRKLTHVDVLDNMGANLVSPVQEILMTPTEIGSQLNLSGAKVNQVLKQLGYLEDYRVGKTLHWKLTKEGGKHSQVLDVGKKHSDGTPVQQIKWYEHVLETLKETVL